MQLHPLLMLIAMVIGMYVWGAIGFLLGPTAMIIIIQVMKVFNLDENDREASAMGQPIKQ